MAIGGVVIGGTADISMAVTALSFSAGLVTRTTTDILITVTIRMITTVMAMDMAIPTGIPLLTGTIMITTASQLTDMIIVIVLAEGLQSLPSSANWLERVTITAPLTELWDQKPVERWAPTNVRAAH